MAPGPVPAMARPSSAVSANGIGGAMYRLDSRRPLRVRRLTQCGIESNTIRPPGNRAPQSAIKLRTSSGSRYISRPSAVMNTPLRSSTRSIQLRSSAD
ncbi:hypothetical protein BN970_03868 [Mycolicibacterium conceptionense]|uniref:Uncharacterized protein n=1 Tax=Mycolicibacterium conceptionense TaxID=451644 RepID=A0A0U1DMN6_9MYCO|nr:hypothetical protein BN970_03868 [Mycolicibacterium conceptionense]